MTLTGILLWIAMSALVSYVADMIYKFSWFKKEKWGKLNVSDAKLIIVYIISEIVMITYVYINKVFGIFGYFGIFLYPIEDAILSGLIVGGGASGVYQLYKTILSYRELLNTKKDLLEQAKQKMEAK